MIVRSLARRILAWVILTAVFGIAGGWLAQAPGLQFGTAAFAADTSQDEFEQRVRLEAKQAEQDAAAAQAVLKAHTPEVFQDPDSPVSGNPNGNVTVVEFFDYNCPYCKMMAPLMAQAETADPQLRIVYKELPILGPGSDFAAKAALAANKQGNYVAFHRALYQLRGHVGEAQVLETARTIGLDVSRLKADMEDKAIAGMLEKNAEIGRTLHITGTPGFVAGDQVTTGATDLKALQAFISRARSGHPEAK